MPVTSFFKVFIAFNLKFELEISKIEGSVHIPMNQIPNRLNELNPENDYVLVITSLDVTQQGANDLHASVVDGNFEGW